MFPFIIRVIVYILYTFAPSPACDIAICTEIKLDFVLTENIHFEQNVDYNNISNWSYTLYSNTVEFDRKISNQSKFNYTSVWFCQNK